MLIQLLPQKVFKLLEIYTISWLTCKLFTSGVDFGSQLGLHAIDLEEALLDLVPGRQVPRIRLKLQRLLHLLNARLPVHYFPEVHLCLPLVALDLLPEIEELILDVCLALVQGLLDLSQIDLSLQGCGDLGQHLGHLIGICLVLSVPTDAVDLTSDPANLLLPLSLARPDDLLDELGGLLDVPPSVLLQPSQGVVQVRHLCLRAREKGVKFVESILHTVLSLLPQHILLALPSGNHVRAFSLDLTRCCSQGLRVHLPLESLSEAVHEGEVCFLR